VSGHNAVPDEKEEKLIFFDKRRGHGEPGFSKKTQGKKKG